MKTTAKKVLSVLVELYAKQNGVRIEYIIDTQNNDTQITDGLKHTKMEVINNGKQV